MCHVGQHLVFEEAEELVNSFTGADINAKQIERACHLYGQTIEGEDLYNIENPNNKVFLDDGATWIWNWVEHTCPNSVQIVDFFHAKEHLCEFAKGYFKDKGELGQWMDRQSEIRIKKGISPVIKTLEEPEPQKGTAKQKEQLLNYYRKNEKRMQYHVLKEKALLIGSGAIESAHKNVPQQRLKLSAQRWTTDALKQMAQPRVVYKNGNDHGTREIIQKAA